MGRMPCGHTCGGCCAVLAAALAAVQLQFQVPRALNPPDTSLQLLTPGWEGALRKNLVEHGYAHVRQLLSPSEVEGLRSIALEFCYGETRRAVPLTWGGYSVPAFLDLEDFSGAHWLVNDTRLHTVLKAAFRGAAYRFASHNDIGCDFVGVWHKDVLRGPQRKYQVHDMWSPDEAGERHEIYKVMFYLQDHADDERALKLVPGSHVTRDISLERGYTSLHPLMGDALIFDQRISHAGNLFYDPVGKGRLFMQVGFGKDNIFTDEFERGTVERQQMHQVRRAAAERPRGIGTLLTDARFFASGMVISMTPPLLANFFADFDVKKYPMLASVIFPTPTK